MPHPYPQFILLFQIFYATHPHLTSSSPLHGLFFHGHYLIMMMTAFFQERQHLSIIEFVGEHINSQFPSKLCFFLIIFLRDEANLFFYVLLAAIERKPTCQGREILKKIKIAFLILCQFLNQSIMTFSSSFDRFFHFIFVLIFFSPEAERRNILQSDHANKIAPNLQNDIISIVNYNREFANFFTDMLSMRGRKKFSLIF